MAFDPAKSSSYAFCQIDPTLVEEHFYIFSTDDYLTIHNDNGELYILNLATKEAESPDVKITGTPLTFKEDTVYISARRGATQEMVALDCTSKEKKTLFALKNNEQIPQAFIGENILYCVKRGALVAYLLDGSEETPRAVNIAERSFSQVVCGQYMGENILLIGADWRKDNLIRAYLLSLETLKAKPIGSESTIHFQGYEGGLLAATENSYCYALPTSMEVVYEQFD